MAFIPETCFTCRHNRTRPEPDFCAKCCAAPKGDPDHAWEPKDTDTSAVVALQEECDQLRERVRILREALERVTTGLQQANEGYSEDNFGDEIRTGLAALEATKEGA